MANIQLEIVSALRWGATALDPKTERNDIPTSAERASVLRNLATTYSEIERLKRGLWETRIVREGELVARLSEVMWLLSDTAETLQAEAALIEDLVGDGAATMSAQGNGDRQLTHREPNDDPLAHPGEWSTAKLIRTLRREEETGWDVTVLAEVAADRLEEVQGWSDYYGNCLQNAVVALDEARVEDR